MSDTRPVLIRQATREEAAAVSTILVEAADWLTGQGRPMWKAGELGPDRIRADVDAGRFFLAVQAGHLVGTIRFDLSDLRFWPDMPDGESAFVHRLAIRRSAARSGVSNAMLQWAVERARAFDRRFLRLDCEASREKLRAVYERFGFRYHSDRQVGPYLVARYEIDLRQVEGVPPPASFAR